MAAQALYRRWRPQAFDDVIGQPHITHTLRQAVATDRLAHAYLFTGPRGTGKTSVARILAKAVNCTAGPGADKPCNRCATCVVFTEGRTLDLIEIDAASNTGVDDVRDLRDKINFAPNAARFKVYIVDEVHMLSTAAFNALLKTLEEPPAHALFILATTEPHKIPDTILSRCQRYDFRRVGVDALVEKLERICAAEGVAAERAALELVAKSATGSIRDAESLLDQLMAAGGAVSLDTVRDAIGTPGAEAVVAIVDAMVDGDAGAGLRHVNAALDQGTDPRQLQNRLLDHLRGLLLIQTGIDADLLDETAEGLAVLRRQAAGWPMPALVAAIHRFNEARPAADRGLPSLPLELALVETVLATRAAGAPAAPAASPAERRTGSTAPAERPAAEPPGGRAGRSAPATRSPAADPPAAQVGPAPAGPTHAPPAAAPRPGGDPLEAIQTRWDAFVAAVNQRDRNTGALLKDCRPVAADAGSVTLGFFYPFHAKHAGEPERAKLLAEALTAVIGARLEVVCVVAKANEEDRAARPRNKTDQAAADPVVRHAIDALGAEIAGVGPDVEDN